MAYKIRVKEAIKRIGSKRDYYKYRDDLKILPVCFEDGKANAPFHLESHFRSFERKLAELYAPKITPKVSPDKLSPLERAAIRIANNPNI